MHSFLQHLPLADIANCSSPSSAGYPVEAVIPSRLKHTLYFSLWQRWNWAKLAWNASTPGGETSLNEKKLSLTQQRLFPLSDKLAILCFIVKPGSCNCGNYWQQAVFIGDWLIRSDWISTVPPFLCVFFPLLEMGWLWDIFWILSTDISTFTQHPPFQNQTYSEFHQTRAMWRAV